ncbi:MAG TPA: crotonase/enoyl-CoA hydratase family protein [Actinomycetota bacterium]|nr:crotonase/enoyl-CoA hydratase family protein [Actinomycetota bacterium]
MTTVRTETRGPTLIVTIDRPDVRNAVDGPTADALSAAFRDFESNDDALVAILTGSAGQFCAGADLQAMTNDPERANRVDPDGDAPMGPTWMQLDKPVIAAVEGHAVAGGFELALWCDLRVAASDATFGFFNRRWGVPLLDGGSVRIGRIVGLGHGLDLLLTGLPVGAEEALAIGLADRVAEPGHALEAAVDLAEQIASFPQAALRAARRSAYDSGGRDLADALRSEFTGGLAALTEAQEGAARFTSGAGRHGAFE